MKIAVKVKKLTNDAIVPTYAKPGDAGFDFHATDEGFLLPGETAVIGTGLAFEIPEGYEIQVRPRSGLAAKHGITVLNSPGTVDAGYRGEVKVILHNAGHGAFEINKGDRIAQGVLSKVNQAKFIEVDELEESERGADGFGSTGVEAKEEPVKPERNFYIVQNEDDGYCD